MARSYIEIESWCKYCGGKLGARTPERYSTVSCSIKGLDYLEYVHHATGRRACNVQTDAAPYDEWQTSRQYRNKEKP